MDISKHQENQRTEAQIREDRLKAALKANMAKRKAQARARAADTETKRKSRQVWIQSSLRVAVS